MKFVILYGWEGNTQANWFPWLKSELGKLGYQVEVFPLPETNHPKLSEWLETTNKFMASKNEEVVLIAHSLGGVLLLHYLEQNRKTPKVKAAIFVASSAKNPGTLPPELGEFFPHPFNFPKIRSATNKFISISGTNDPFVKTDFSEDLANNLGIKPIWVEGGGHLAEEWGYTEFPLLLATIKKELKI